VSSLPGGGAAGGTEGAGGRRSDGEFVNWAGNVRFRPAGRAEPASTEQLQELVANAARVRVVGAGHSFSPLVATSGTLVSLRRLVRPAEVDAGTGEAWVSAGATYAEVGPELDRAGWALANLASLPQITVAGAVVTATHGSGSANRALSDAVTGLELVGADGTLHRLEGGALAGAVVSLGALGVLTRVRVRLEPSYQAAQRVWQDLPLVAALEHLGEVLDLGWSVSLFTDWRNPDRVDQVWVKQRLHTEPPDATGAASPAASDGRRLSGADDPAGDADDLLDRLGARRATVQLHPLADGDPGAATEQLGRPGAWHCRLPHFRPDSSPSGAGAELQSEWLVDRADGADALGRLRGLADRLAGAVRVCEVRAVGADQAWLSPAYQRDSVALHLTWRPQPSVVWPLVAEIEAALADLGPRPHWAKLWQALPAIARADDFRRLVTSHDPAGCFANPLLERVLGAATA